MNILIIGGGNMGATYARSFLRGQATAAATIRILEANPAKAAQLAAQGLGEVGSDAARLVPAADLVVLAVKPQDAPALFASLRPLVRGHQVVLSIMAGVTIATITEGLGMAKVVRAMPNLPAQVGKGMTAYTAGAEVTRLELATVQDLLATTGEHLYVAREGMLDAATAVSGSGPAYVFYFMRAMMARAQALGFTASEAELLVLQTFAGGIGLYQAGHLDCDEWIARVSSKGGTTEAAMRTFDAGDVSGAVERGLQAAFDRAVELGRPTDVGA